MRGVLIVLAVAALGLSCAADAKVPVIFTYRYGMLAPQRFCGFTVSKVAELHAKLSGTWEPSRDSANAYTTYLNGSDLATRTVTLTDPGNAAHPAAACREVADLHGKPAEQWVVICEATKVACDGFAQNFKDFADETAAIRSDTLE